MEKLNFELLKGRAKNLHLINKNNGFWEGNQINLNLKLNLVMSEVWELFECVRKNQYADLDKYFAAAAYSKEDFPVKEFKEFVKDTVEAELADIHIRIFDFLVGFNMLDSFINKLEKLETFNKGIQNSEMFWLFKDKAQGRIADFIEFVNINFYKEGKTPLLRVYHLYLQIEAYAYVRNINIPVYMAKIAEYNSRRGYKHGKKF